MVEDGRPPILLRSSRRRIAQSPSSIRIEFDSVYSIPPAEAGLNADIRLRMSSGEALNVYGVNGGTGEH